MINRKKIFLLSMLLMLGIGLVVLVQKTLATEVTEMVALDEDIQPQDLEISAPRLLPDNPFYFLKNWLRAIQNFFTFNQVKKAELKLKFANERLMEVKMLIQKEKEPEIIERAATLYQEEVAKVRNEVEKIREKARENPRVESFLDKFIHQQTLHQKLLQKLEEQVPPQAFEKIKEARERHLERFRDVMLKLEDRHEKITEKLDKILEEQKGSQFKEFKNLEVLKNLEEKVPEETKEAIQKAQENALKRLKKDFEKLSPAEQKKFREYIERISGEKETQLEILEDVVQPEIKEVEGKLITVPSPIAPEEIMGVRPKIIEKIEKKLEKIGCPVWPIPAPDFCEKGRVVIEKDPETGCPLPPKCIIPGELKILERPIPFPLPLRPEVREVMPPEVREVRPPEVRELRLPEIREIRPPEVREVTPEVREIKPKVCIMLWDPVCGKDGKTYSNECFARLAGVEIDYKGVCKKEERKIPLEELKIPLPPVFPKKPPPREFCLQVITYAISPEGECHQFSSTCDVPEGWRIVPGC